MHMQGQQNAFLNFNKSVMPLNNQLNNYLNKPGALPDMTMQRPVYGKKINI